GGRAMRQAMMHVARRSFDYVDSVTGQVVAIHAGLSWVSADSEAYVLRPDAFRSSSGANSTDQQSTFDRPVEPLSRVEVRSMASMPFAILIEHRIRSALHREASMARDGL